MLGYNFQVDDLINVYLTLISHEHNGQFDQAPPSSPILPNRFRLQRSLAASYIYEAEQTNSEKLSEASRKYESVDEMYQRTLSELATARKEKAELQGSLEAQKAAQSSAISEASKNTQAEIVHLGQ